MATAKKRKAKAPLAGRRPDQQRAMLELITGYWMSQLVFVAAKLGVADELRGGALKIDVLAKRVGAHAPSLYRVLRALAGRCVFAETADGRFKLTPLGSTLRSDAPRSLRAFAQMMVEEYNWRAWGSLLQGVRTGERPFDEIYGMPLFDWMKGQPEHERIFSQSMASLSATENEAIAKAYDFSRFETLVDVGGAHGHLLAAILRRHKRLRGVLFDQPQVVEGATKSGFFSAPDVARRSEFRGGSFFDGVPQGADGYVMKYVIHDWDDELSRRILRHCRAAMAPGGRVLVVDHVITRGNKPDWGKQLDINMMVLPGGQERTKEEFQKLLAASGLRLTRVVPTASPLSILEAVAA
jgi:hypothetical protein